jgi:hypothetical protein
LVQEKAKAVVFSIILYSLQMIKMDSAMEHSDGKIHDKTGLKLLYIALDVNTFPEIC